MLQQQSLQYCTGTKYYWQYSIVLRVSVKVTVYCHCVANHVKGHDRSSDEAIALIVNMMKIISIFQKMHQFSISIDQHCDCQSFHHQVS